jgi:hypothetical protein
MSEETANNSSEPNKPVDINDFTQSTADTFRERSKRIAKRKERASSVIDDVWDNASGDAKRLKDLGSEPETLKVEGYDENQQREVSDSRESDEGTEEPKRTFKDVTDDMWESERGESETEEVAEEHDADLEGTDESITGEEDEEISSESDEERDDVIFATVEGEEGPEQIEIPKDAVISVKVDGVDQEISLQEFANGISGQKAISQKFSALNGEQKAFESRLETWNDTSAKAVELMNDNKAVEAIQHVAGMMGQDPQLLFTSLFEEITPVLNQYADLSEQDRSVWVQDLKNKKAEFQARSAQDELNKLRTAQEQQGKVQKVQEAYGLDEATFTHAYHALESEIQAGSLPKQPITPELVGEYSKLVQIEGFAESALVGTQYEGDPAAVNQILQTVNQMARNGVEVSEQSVKDMVSEALGREKQIEKSKSVQKSLKKKGVKPKSKGGKKPKQMSRKNPSDVPNHWMDRALNELDKGSNASDLGLMSNKQNKRR